MTKISVDSKGKKKIHSKYKDKKKRKQERKKEMKRKKENSDHKERETLKTMSSVLITKVVQSKISMNLLSYRTLKMK